MNVFRLIELSPKNGGIIDSSSNREHPLCSDLSSKLFPSPKLLGYASVSFARRGKRGECREATLSRLLLEIFMKYRTVLYSTEYYCVVQDIIVSVHLSPPGPS